jgi:hypothetical protein
MSQCLRKSGIKAQRISRNTFHSVRVIFIRSIDLLSFSDQNLLVLMTKYRFQGQIIMAVKEMPRIMEIRYYHDGAQ